MIKELMENLLIEFDEMGFEPTTLCDTRSEVDSFRNRLKQVLDYLKAIDNASPSEALECLKEMWELSCDSRKPEYILYDTIKQALIKSQEQEDEKKVEALKELFANHIEFVVEKDRCYFKIKNSKGKEKSFTSYSMLDFWKEVLI